MIPYIVGKLAPNSPHWTRGLVRYVPGRGYFRAVPSQNGDKFVTSPPPPIVVYSIFLVDLSPTFYCLTKPLFVYGSMVLLLSTLLLLVLSSYSVTVVMLSYD